MKSSEVRGRAQNAEIFLVPKDKLAYFTMVVHVHGQSPPVSLWKTTKLGFPDNGLFTIGESNSIDQLNQMLKMCGPEAESGLQYLKRSTIKIQISGFFKRKIRPGLFGPGPWRGDSCEI